MSEETIKRPSFPFYPGDWLSNTELQSCSLSAQAVWIKLMCFLHKSKPYGTLMVNHKVVPMVNLARMLGLPIEELTTYIQELEDAGVFKRTKEGAIKSNRMIRDEELRNLRAAGGSKGGNPNIKKPLSTSKVIDKVNHQGLLASNLSPEKEKESVNEKEKEVIKEVDNVVHVDLSPKNEGKAKKKKPEKKKEIPPPVQEQVSNDLPPGNKVAQIIMPFPSAEFTAAWIRWIDYRKNVKKKPYKSLDAIQMNLDNLKQYDEQFAIHLINRSIREEYQGLIFTSTPMDYEVWQKTNKKPTTKNSAKHSDEEYNKGFSGSSAGN